MIIVIDGPAGSGKSTTAKALADRLNLHFLDSGALYRAVTYYWIKQDKPNNDEFIKMLPDIELEVKLDEDLFTVYLNGENISNEIRSPAVADNVSKIASLAEVRLHVNSFMRKLVKKGEFIADGRDLGTAVFPDADLKFYMDASIKERAKRRFEELSAKNKDITLNSVVENLKSRDYTDKNRSADPLRKADDAVVIDTTGKTFDEQVDQMATIIKDRLKLKY